MIRLSLKYIRFFKQQSLYVLLGIIATVAILTAITSAFEANNKMELERAREIYGDYHYAYKNLADIEVEKAFSLAQECGIERIGYQRLGKSYGGYDNPMALRLSMIDRGCQDILGLKLLEGRYPKWAGEIALEKWVLAYLTEDGLGAQIEMEGDAYTVTGILKDRENDKGYGLKHGYVSEEDTDGGSYLLYLKYDESRDISKLQADFHEKSGIGEDAIQNRNLLYKIDYRKFNVTGYDIDFSYSSDNGQGTVRGEAFKEWLAGMGMDKALGTIMVTIFSMIILYSIFRISVQQRIREYGKMEAFGLERKDIAILLGSELLFLFLAGFPIGTSLGAALIWGIYQFYRGVGAVDFSVSYLGQLSPRDIMVNAGLILLILLFIVLLVTFQLGRMNVIETIRGKKEKKKTGRGYLRSKKAGEAGASLIWSRKTNHMMPVVLLKYILERKGRVITMILMLALGGTVFLTGSYIEEQVERNHKLTQMSDNGTNADIKVAIENLRLAGEIREEQVEKMKALPEVRLAEPVSFYFGAILLKKEQIRDSALEKGFWENLDKYNPLIETVGGHMFHEGNGQYNLKTEFYGYDEEMLREMEDFVLEGDIDSVKQKDTVIFQTEMDGVGNWDIIGLHVGDRVTLRFPKENPGRITEENMRILGILPQGEFKDAYEERTFTIGAIVKGGVADNEEFLTYPPPDTTGIIMTNDQFGQCFDVDGYNIVSVQLENKKTADETANEIRSILKGVDGCSVIDYTEEIIRQKEYLEQTMILVRIIVILLLAIGFFNILSTVNYILMEKKKEFAVMRAMGITDSRLMCTMAWEGVAYGSIISILMIIFTIVIQIPVKYFMDHGFVFINAQYSFYWPLAIGVTGVNILLSLIAVILPAKRVLFHEITEELSDIG